MSVYAAIAQASLDVGGALGADKRNDHQNYNYISADKILTVCGQALAKAGVVVVPSVVSESMEAIEYSDRYGKMKTRYDALVEFCFFIGTDEGEPLTMTWTGRGNDSATPDKAHYKAITSGHKYFLMKLLNVGAGNEDGEHESEPVATPQRQQKNGNGSAPNRQDVVEAPPVNFDEAAPTGPAWVADPSSILFGSDYSFSGKSEALAWGMAMDVFNVQKHADNAYEALKKETQPKNAAEMWAAWIDDVARRVNEAKSEPVAA